MRNSTIDLVGSFHEAGEHKFEAVLAVPREDGERVGLSCGMRVTQHMNR